jgi:LPS-assembly protein
VFSLKYADDCFALTASYTETFVTNTTLGLVPDRTVMLRFELKHLGEVGYKTNQVNSLFTDMGTGTRP